MMGKLNHHVIDNVDAKVYTLDFPFEFNSESVTDTENTMIRSIDDNEIDHLLELFHRGYDGDILDDDLQML